MENSLSYIAEAAKYLSVGLISLVMLGVAKGVSQIWVTIISAVSRNPAVQPLPKRLPCMPWVWRLSCYICKDADASI